jgi:AraC-like DNA-binding protein
MTTFSSEIAYAVRPDALSDVLQDLRIAGVSYSRCELSSPWGVAFPAQAATAFHFVAAGVAWLRVPGGEWQELRAGDMVLLPHGTGHTLADVPDRPAQRLDTLALEPTGEQSSRLISNPGGARTLLFCCSASVADPALHPLLELMPPALIVRGDTSVDPLLPALLRTMAEEATSQRVGAASVLARLADVMIARVIRAWVEHECPNTSGWIAAMRDPHLGRALAAMHRDPGQPWSVEALADVAGASRSMFSERFTTIVGSSPGRYLTRWRMHVARRWLRTERLSVAEVAARLGYESEGAFSRAFKRVVGVPPSALRRVEAQEQLQAA